MSGTFKSKKNNIIVKKKKPKIEDENFNCAKIEKIGIQWKTQMYAVVYL